jgi:hypothetical protein
MTSIANLVIILHLFKNLEPVELHDISIALNHPSTNKLANVLLQ